ncbi:hypothetical protein U27_05401 [Candidatus Vecturithrix granuli]|uniref:Uncharacterized protein n=1 Tax=Vecturithrix granuli TaxID=1499967 RepID=A0A081C1H2_VECG1|nr:hypothetical protein U27_05401 [Candidatus Vecturithrix granuli]
MSKLCFRCQSRALTLLFTLQPGRVITLGDCRQFGEEPKPGPEMAALRVLAGKKALLILDGAEDADNLPRVLDICGTCGVLITSRSKKDAGADRQDIAPLQTAEGVELLRKWSGNPIGAESIVTRIYELVGGLPLALRLVGRYLHQTGEPALEYQQ